MNINFKVEEVVRKRQSIRNYSDQTLDEDTINKVKAFIQTLHNPFNKKVSYHFLDSEDINEHQKLGTYGVIKGAKKFIGTTIDLSPLSLEALGYEMEILILYLAHLGLGTCWLGGTFDRKGFAKAMHVSDNEIFPIITPYGYAAPTKHLKEIAMRRIIKADQRKDWSLLFFNNDFNTPLTKEEANDMAFALEMVRLGPSASNKQPWRILRNNNVYHFFEYKEPGYSSIFSYDIQRIDLGIAAAHFDCAVKELGIVGHFDSKLEPTLPHLEHLEYVFSWVREPSNV